MIYVFLCLDWVPISQSSSVVEPAELPSLHPSSARDACLEKLATCLEHFAGAVGVLATSRTMGQRFNEVQSSLGRLKPRVFDMVNTLAESPYEFVCDYLFTRPGDWVAIADTSDSFPPEHRHRVVSFAGDAREIETACAELANLIGSFGPVAIEGPTRRELALISGDRHMVALMKAHFAAPRRAALPND